MEAVIGTWVFNQEHALSATVEAARAFDPIRQLAGYLGFWVEPDSHHGNTVITVALFDTKEHRDSASKRMSQIAESDLRSALEGL